MNIKALAYVSACLVLGQSIFLVTFGSRFYARWALAWLSLTAVAFLVPDFSAVIFVIILLSAWSNRDRIQGPLAHYCMILPAYPASITYEVPGLLPGIKQFITLNYTRVLSLILLLPCAYRMWMSRHDSRELFKNKIDPLVCLYVMYLSSIGFRDYTITGAVRNAIHVFLDIGIPYFVLSRGLRCLDDFKRVFLGILYSAVLLGTVGVFESGKSWLLYRHMAVSESSFNSSYLVRAGLIRIEGPFYQPIPFGFFLVLGLASLIFLARYAWDKKTFLLAAGLIIGITGVLTVTRMTWTGMGLIAVLWGTVENPHRRLKFIAVALVAGVLVIPVLATLPIFHEFVDQLPFIGSSEQVSVSYRELLLEQAVEVIKETPFFGNPDWMNHPKLEKLYQHRVLGLFIDIVNSYLQIALPLGLVGAGLFLGVQISAAFAVWIGIRGARLRRDEDWTHLGRILFACNLTIIFMLTTTSSISSIPNYTWLILALCSAYATISSKLPRVPTGHEPVVNDGRIMGR